MTICSFSDNHGGFPDIKDHYDVITCSGDFSPLEYQRSFKLMMDWIECDFLPWVKDLDCDKFIMIAGNHDFCCENPNFLNMFMKLVYNEHLEDKLVYLENQSYVYNDVKFFGCPYSNIPGWAFSIANNPAGYKDIEYDVDVLLVHQAPDYENVGTSHYESEYLARNFGSQELFDEIKKKEPKNVVCGHIHTGNHNPVVYGKTTIRNVSLLNERYDVQYGPAVFAI